MSVKLLTGHHLAFLSLKGGCRGSCESTLVKMQHSWKSHVTAHVETPICPSGNDIILSKYHVMSGCHGDCFIELGKANLAVFVFFARQPHLL